MARRAFEPLHVSLDLHHRDGSLAAEALASTVQVRNLMIGAARAVNNDAIASPYHVSEGVAAGGQEVTVLGVIICPDAHLFGRLARYPAWSVAVVEAELITEPERQVPRRPRRCSMAVRTFDFHLSQVGTEEVPITTHVDGRVAILTEQTTLSRSAMMPVVLYEQITLAVKRRLHCTVGIGGAIPCGLHQPLEADADPLSTVVAGRTCLDGNSRVLGVTNPNHRLPRRLDAMNKNMSGESRGICGSAPS